MDLYLASFGPALDEVLPQLAVAARDAAPEAAGTATAAPTQAKLARAVGIDVDTGVVGRIAGKKGSDLHPWNSARRAAAGALGPADGSRGMIDALHHAAHAARERTVAAAAEMLGRAGLDREPRFFAALEAVLEILPLSKTFTGIALEGAVEASGSDFEGLYHLYHFAYDDRIDEPDQLRLWRRRGNMRNRISGPILDDVGSGGTGPR